MKFFSSQYINDGSTWAVNLFFFYICSVGIVINDTNGKRTDIFLSLGILPFSCAFSIGMAHATFS